LSEEDNSSYEDMEDEQEIDIEENQFGDFPLELNEQFQNFLQGNYGIHQMMNIANSNEDAQNSKIEIINENQLILKSPEETFYNNEISKAH